ncbi:hypothetical protein NB537_16895, partial [Vibrio parahaemolyticus]
MDFFPIGKAHNVREPNAFYKASPILEIRFHKTIAQPVFWIFNMISIQFLYDKFIEKFIGNTSTKQKH